MAGDWSQPPKRRWWYGQGRPPFMEPLRENENGAALSPSGEEQWSLN